MSKYTIEDVKNHCNMIGLKLISNEFVNVKEPLVFECTDCKKPFNRSFDNLKKRNKTVCRECGVGKGGLTKASNTRSYKDVKDFCEEIGAILLSQTYIDSKKPLLFRCTNCNEDFNRNFDNLKSRKSTECKTCGKKKSSKKNSFKYEDVKKSIENNSTRVLLSKEYINTDSPLSIRCECGEIFKATYYKFSKANKKFCQKCSSRKVSENLLKTLPEVESMCESIGYKLIKRNTGVGVHVLTLQCQNNHKPYNVNYSKFKSGQRCPYCSESNGETVVREFLENHHLKYEKEYTFKDLTGLGGQKLRYDFAVFKEEGVFLVEFDGKQHFEVTEIFGGQSNFQKTRYHDDLKNKYCENNNIPLIRISYKEINKVEGILKKYLTT